MVFKSVGKTGKERYYIDGEEVTKRRYNREMEASHVKIEATLRIASAVGSSRTLLIRWAIILDR